MKKTRMTTQRLKILEYLKRVKTHPTAEMVYREIVKEMPSITLATVYRNLNLLAEQGQILRIEINKEYRYDGDTCCHQHFVCNKCAKIIDIDNKKVTEYAMKNADDSLFRAEGVEIIYNGLCKECDLGEKENGMQKLRKIRRRFAKGKR